MTTNEEKTSKLSVREFCDMAEALGLFTSSNYAGRFIRYRDRNEAFFGAVIDGDARRVKWLLDGGADVNYGDALRRAVSSDNNGDHAEAVKILVLDGAKLYRDTIAKDLLPGGWETPLVSAAGAGKVAIVQAILSYGSVAQKDKDRAASSAGVEGHWDVFDVLTKAGAEPGFRPSNSVKATNITSPKP